MRISKLSLSIATVVAASSITAYTFAAPDYNRIKKDINVMIGIVKSSFNENDDCRKCSIKISGHYLAEQGVVFNVSPSSGHFQYGFDYDSDHEGSIFKTSVVAIPSMVEEILEDVQVRIDTGDFQSFEFHSNDDWSDAAREAREGLREARHGLRELSRELRQLEIEAIHAEDDELKELESREVELEAEIAKREANHKKLINNLNATTEEKNKERESRRAKKLDKRREQFEQMESIVLNTFCDYSSTMRNIPDDENVSIIVRKGDDDSNIYIFEQSRLASCDSAKDDVREHALSYVF